MEEKQKRERKRGGERTAVGSHTQIFSQLHTVSAPCIEDNLSF